MKTVKPLVVLLLCGVCNVIVAWAQTTHIQWNPQQYFGIADSNKKALFVDNFSGQEDNWRFQSAHMVMRVDREAGELYCESLRNKPMVKQRVVAINDSLDYEISIRMRCILDDSNNPLGLTFGRDASSNSDFNFYFRPDGTYSIQRIENNENSKLYVSAKPFEHLNKTTYNALTVRKVDGIWYFFINRILVHQMPAEPFFGNGVGFTIGGLMKAEIDEISVSQIELRDNVGPKLTLTSPIFDRSNALLLDEEKLLVSGRVEDISGVTHLTVNGEEEINIDPKGGFALTLRLPEGEHTITLAARDGRNNVTTRVFTVNRRSPETAQIQQPQGKNYLMIIGIDRYTHWNPLKNAVKDCNDLVGLLTKEYKFEQTDVYALYNEQANMDNIIETFEYLQKKLTDQDNLLVYYAGHGWYDKESQIGYWIPVGARQEKVVDYLRNSTVRDYVKAIKSRNTLLLVDACYAGSMFEASRGVLDENMKSRWAFTSGNLQKVGDGEPGQNSPFARYLMLCLHNNTKQRLRADELISRVKSLVELNSNQQPQGSPIIGDEGGVFIFQRR